MNEQKCAAYLGYGDVSEYRRFRFSGPVLGAHRRYTLSSAKKKDYKAAIDILEGVPLADLPLDKDLSEHPPVYKLATIIAELYLAVKHAEEQELPTLNEKFEEAKEHFHKDVLTVKAKDLALPYISMEKPCLPSIGAPSRVPGALNGEVREVLQSVNVTGPYPCAFTDPKYLHDSSYPFHLHACTSLGDTQLDETATTKISPLLKKDPLPKREILIQCQY
jgi:hypothetical protein